MTLISFETALDQTKEKDRTLFLGNGFSIAQTHGKFSYRNLLSKSDLDTTSGARKTFDELATEDFEEVIKSLEHAAVVARAYGMAGAEKEFQEGADKVREALISAVHKVHPDNFTSIPKKEVDTCVSFLKNFSEVYTVNYDLLLYWVSLQAGSFNDGFGLGTKKDGFRSPFQEDAHCSIFNIHGGLHLFLDDYRDIAKRIATADHLIDEISTTIRDRKKLPLFVAEGTTQQKLNRIRSVPYLDYCYRRLFELTDILFIFGHDIVGRDGNPCNDIHIYDAIFDSKVTDLYFCVFTAAKLPKIKEALAPLKERNKKITTYFVDAAKMDVWGKEQ